MEDMMHSELEHDWTQRHIKPRWQGRLPETWQPGVAGPIRPTNFHAHYPG